MSVNDKIGGYPEEWFVKAPSDNFKCGICLDVLKNPHQCKKGHNFCHSCISLALQKHSECPTCKTVLSSESLCINLSLRNVIDEMLVVKCCHDGGCDWTGTLEQSLKHFPLCSMRSVPCPLHEHRACTDKSCTGSIKRKDLHKHVSNGNKSDVANTMLIMAETIAYQRKEIELLHKFILSGETKIHLFGESTVVGVLKDGEMDGFGFIKDSDCTYSGHFSKGHFSGFGVLRSNKIERAGMWENNKLNGHGMERFPDTEGETLQNCSSVDTYIGDFIDHHKHGFGRMINTDGTYLGSFVNDMLHGEVTRLFSSGDVLVTTFDNNKRLATSTSILTIQDGTVYCGSVDDNCYFVKGKYTNIKGVMYEGTFCDNANELQLNGTGKITYTDYFVYTGEFLGGLKHGKGTIFRDNGQIHAAGVWDKDKLVTPYFRGGASRTTSSTCSNVTAIALNVAATSGSDVQNIGTAGVGGKRKYS